MERIKLSVLVGVIALHDLIFFCHSAGVAVNAEHELDVDIVAALDIEPESLWVWADEAGELIEAIGGAA